MAAWTTKLCSQTESSEGPGVFRSHGRAGSIEREPNARCARKGSIPIIVSALMAMITSVPLTSCTKICYGRI